MVIGGRWRFCSLWTGYTPGIRCGEGGRLWRGHQQREGTKPRAAEADGAGGSSKGSGSGRGSSSSSGTGAGAGKGNGTCGAPARWHGHSVLIVVAGANSRFPRSCRRCRLRPRAAFFAACNPCAPPAHRLLASINVKASQRCMASGSFFRGSRGFDQHRPRGRMYPYIFFNRSQSDVQAHRGLCQRCRVLQAVLHPVRGHVHPGCSSGGLVLHQHRDVRAEFRGHCEECTV